jgi:hypothetical protein
MPPPGEHQAEATQADMEKALSTLPETLGLSALPETLDDDFPDANVTALEEGDGALQRRTPYVRKNVICNRFDRAWHNILSVTLTEYENSKWFPMSIPPGRCFMVRCVWNTEMAFCNDVGCNPMAESMCEADMSMQNKYTLNEHETRQWVAAGRDGQKQCCGGGKDCSFQVFSHGNWNLIYKKNKSCP